MLAPSIATLAMLPEADRQDELRPTRKAASASGMRSTRSRTVADTDLPHDLEALLLLGLVTWPSFIRITVAYSSVRSWKNPPLPWYGQAYLVLLSKYDTANVSAVPGLVLTHGSCLVHILVEKAVRAWELLRGIP